MADVSREESGFEAWWATRPENRDQGLTEESVVIRQRYAQAGWEAHEAQSREAENANLQRRIQQDADTIQDLYAAVEAAERDRRFILDTLDALAATVDAHLEFGTGGSLIGLKSMLKQARKVHAKALEGGVKVDEPFVVLKVRDPERETVAEAALETIRRDYGHVCPEFEICTHLWCASSYGAWATADEALRALTAESEGRT